MPSNDPRTTVLPLALITLFDGNRLEEKTAISAMLATIDLQGWSHASFLSAGEVLAHDDHRLGLLLWPTSTTAANVVRSGRATLFTAAEGAVWEARLAIEKAGAARDGEPQAFHGETILMRRHAAPYAQVTSMIGFQLHDPASAIARWHDQIQRLRDAG